MKDDDFIFGCVQLLYYKCHKINLNCGILSIDSPGWIKNKNETINHLNKNDNKCFQYVATLALKHNKIQIFRKNNKFQTFYR